MSTDLQKEVERLRKSLAYLQGAAQAVLEANELDIECRADEDCDHCVLVSAIASVDVILAQTPPASGAESEPRCPCGQGAWADPKCQCRQPAESPPKESEPCEHDWSGIVEMVDAPPAKICQKCGMWWERPPNSPSSFCDEEEELDTKNLPKLKPCPRCGSKLEYWDTDPEYVGCSNDDCLFSMVVSKNDLAKYYRRK